jgi:hypothetical protein
LVQDLLKGGLTTLAAAGSLKCTRHGCSCKDSVMASWYSSSKSSSATVPVGALSAVLCRHL